MTVGERIKKIRLSRGYTQQKLADLVGYKDKASISIIEKNGDDLTQSKILAFSKALGVTPGELLGPAEEQFETKLTAETAQLVIAYNAAPDILKEAVCRVLSIERPKGGKQ